MQAWLGHLSAGAVRSCLSRFAETGTQLLALRRLRGRLPSPSRTLDALDTAIRAELAQVTELIEEQERRHSPAGAAPSASIRALSLAARS